jgi:hypothetical protein
MAGESFKTWLIASRQLPNVDWASERDVTTTQPKGMLLIGRTRTIEIDRDQRESLERFRQHLWNPEVIVYDELYARPSSSWHDPPLTNRSQRCHRRRSSSTTRAMTSRSEGRDERGPGLGVDRDPRPADRSSFVRQVQSGLPGSSMLARWN